jgi:hypothetical protein
MYYRRPHLFSQKTTKYIKDTSLTPDGFYGNSFKSVIITSYDKSLTESVITRNHELSHNILDNYSEIGILRTYIKNLLYIETHDEQKQKIKLFLSLIRGYSLVPHETIAIFNSMTIPNGLDLSSNNPDLFEHLSPDLYEFYELISQATSSIPSEKIEDSYINAFSFCIFIGILSLSPPIFKYLRNKKKFGDHIIHQFFSNSEYNPESRFKLSLNYLIDNDLLNFTFENCIEHFIFISQKIHQDLFEVPKIENHFLALVPSDLLAYLKLLKKSDIIKKSGKYWKRAIKSEIKEVKKLSKKYDFVDSFDLKEAFEEESVINVRTTGDIKLINIENLHKILKRNISNKYFCLIEIRPLCNEHLNSGMFYPVRERIMVILFLLNTKSRHKKYIYSVIQITELEEFINKISNYNIHIVLSSFFYNFYLNSCIMFKLPDSFGELNLIISATREKTLKRLMKELSSNNQQTEIIASICHSSKNGKKINSHIIFTSYCKISKKFTRHIFLPADDYILAYFDKLLLDMPNITDFRKLSPYNQKNIKELWYSLAFYITENGWTNYVNDEIKFSHFLTKENFNVPVYDGPIGLEGLYSESFYFFA